MASFSVESGNNSADLNDTLPHTRLTERALREIDHQTQVDYTPEKTAQRSGYKNNSEVALFYHFFPTVFLASPFVLFGKKDSEQSHFRVIRIVDVFKRDFPVCQERKKFANRPLSTGADVKRRIVSFFGYLISRKTSQHRWKVDDWRIFFFPDKLENPF